MKKTLIFGTFCILVVGFSFAGQALAYISPNICLSGGGAIMVNADPNSSIELAFTQAGSSLPTRITNFGMTSSNGSYTGNVSTYSIPGGAQIYVTVNGQQSNQVVYGSSYYSGSNCNGYNGGCTYNCGSPYGLSLSQNSLSLTAGQNGTVSIYNNGSYYSGNYYISSNSNSSVASASVSGSTVNVYGSTSGSTTISVCQNSYSSCANLYVTVSGYGSGSGNIYFSPSSVSLTAGQNSTVTIYGNSGYYSGNYYISSNSNSSVASASISGSSLYVNALTSGSANIAVCQNSYSNCATLYVTVTGSSCGYYGCNVGGMTLNPSSLSLSVGQSAAVTASYPYPVYGNSNFYISSNSNSSVASASISGSTVNVYGLTSGSTTISVCATGSGSACVSLYVTVTGSSCGPYGCGTGALSLSQSSFNLTQGQSIVVSAYNVPALYVSSNSNPSAVSVSVNVSQATFYGQASGSSTVVLCGISSSQCASVYVTVSGGSYYGGSGSVSLGQANLNLNSGQSGSVNIFGSGSYYVSSNSNSSVASASISGNTLNVYGSQNGSTTIAVCQNSYSNCANLYVTVSGYAYNYGGNYGNGLQYPGSNVLGASTYPNGQLIAENGTVYIVYKNTKTGFVNSNVFTNFGFRFANVVSVGNSGLVDSGYVINTYSTSHPWGSWIKNGKTIYFVHESGLVPVPNWDTFINNGGQAVWTVNANSADLRLPILSAMATNDFRLR